jgi:uncharacterized protein YyaL (SSP411 family)
MRVLRRFAGVTFIAAMLAAGLRIQAVSYPQTPAPTAGVQLEAARTVALEESRNILVEFGASWCGWCRRFDAFVQSADAGAVMRKHFVVVKFTVQESPDKRALNTPGAQTLMNEWGGAESGLPFYVFLDPKGGKLADSNAMPTGANVGYPATPLEIQSFSRLLEKAAPRMTADERERITQYLVTTRGG